MEKEYVFELIIFLKVEEDWKVVYIELNVGLPDAIVPPRSSYDPSEGVGSSKLAPKSPRRYLNINFFVKVVEELGRRAILFAGKWGICGIAIGHHFSELSTTFAGGRTPQSPNLGGASSGGVRVRVVREWRGAFAFWQSGVLRIRLVPIFEAFYDLREVVERPIPREVVEDLESGFLLELMWVLRIDWAISELAYDPSRKGSK
ncbi:unnamed protein product [Pleuronectes platessa]|uniref:Uncharacterized protein n=1 Tax=Pleuronectes platessa TaxID=8262 RepID=A0A9N7TS52_PLEPL|nr:unnamed protein product [Pleuronectes platessa]